MPETGNYPYSVDIELDSPQPAEVARAVAEALAAEANSPDPWWQAGIAEQLET